MGSRVFSPVVLALLTVAGSTAWCLLAQSQLSATFDEPVYLKCGLDCWRNHTHKPLMRLGTMPLPVDLATFPLYAIERITGTPFDLDRDFVWMLRTARITALVFWWNLLFQAWRLGHWVGQQGDQTEGRGAWCGFWMVQFLAWEPNLLGHACLATTDIAVTGCLFGLVNAYLRWRRGPDVSTVASPSAERVSRFGWWPIALWWGLSLFAKASSLVFAPLLLIAIEVGYGGRALRNHEPWKEVLSGFLGRIRHQIGIGLAAFAIVFALCGSDWTTESTFVQWAQGLGEGPFKTTMVFLSDHLRIFTNAGEGFAQQIKHNLRGHPSYLLGMAHEKAVWYHFPVLLLIKLPTSFLVLLPLLVYEQWRKPWYFGLAASLLFLAFSINCRVQIGIRLLFPLVFLLTVLSAYSWNEWLSLRPPATKGLLGTALCSFLIFQALRPFPDGIRYLNDFWRHTDGLVSDSNCDWGQGLVELAAHPFAQTSGSQGIEVLYWGGADPRANIAPLHRAEPIEWKPENEEQARQFLGGKRIAASATILYGPPLQSPYWERVRRALQGEAPVGKTRCFFLFDFTGAPAAPIGGTSGD